MRRLFVCIVLVLAATAAFAQTDPPSARISDIDRAAIRPKIEKQLDAFSRDDAAAAFALNSSKIRGMFRTPERFMSMVLGSYAALYRPKEVTFRDIVDLNGIVAQRVYVRGRDGVPVIAVYPMEQGIDGEWRIDGCMLWPVPESAV
ncbi:MAG: DUF4864 domain-containing protein [Rhodospirillaceae bacterium]|nr:DUF4864 domain-containing protein [Rhodospirillaceae bacterium]